MRTAADLRLAQRGHWDGQRKNIEPENDWEVRMGSAIGNQVVYYAYPE
jgi:hypothetical protein